MKKLMEYEGDEAIDITVNVMADVVPLLRDEEILEAWRDNVLAGFKMARKKKPDEFKQMLASYCNQTVDEFECNPINVITVMGAMCSDPVMMSFFALPSQKTDGDVSGSVTESTEDIQQGDS